MRRAEGGAKIVGVFRVKNDDFTPKNHIFSNFRVRPPPLGSVPDDEFLVGFVLLDPCFLCSVLYIVVCTFLLAIVLSVLRIPTSDYHFGIFKTFLS